MAGIVEETDLTSRFQPGDKVHLSFVLQMDRTTP